MANIDPVQTAGSFIRTMKLLDAEAKRLQSSGVVSVRRVKDSIDTLSIRLERAKGIIADLQAAGYTNTQIRDRLAERLSITPADIVQAWIAARDAITALLTDYVQNVSLPRESAFDVTEKRHLENTVDVATLTSLQTNLTAVVSALQPFAD